MEALKILYEHGAEHWDQKVDNLSFCDNASCDDGKVMVVDLEDVQFPDKIRQRETNVNLGGVGSLMSDFRDVGDRNRGPSPVSFQMTRPGYVGTTELRGSTQLMNRGNTEERKSIVPLVDTRKEGNMRQ